MSLSRAGIVSYDYLDPVPGYSGTPLKNRNDRLATFQSWETGAGGEIEKWR